MFMFTILGVARAYYLHILHSYLIERGHQHENKIHLQSVPIATNVKSSNPAQAQSTRYNIL